MAEFELLRVHDAGQLHQNLEKLLSNKKHVESIVVDQSLDEIRVDLSKMANTFGNPDFRLKLRTGKASEARALIERMKAQTAPLRTQSEELFAMLQH